MKKQGMISGNGQRGMITVEMCTILFLFTFGMLAILCAISMIQTQVFVQNAVNQTAKEISQYSYLLYRTGYVEMVQKQNKSGADLQNQFNQLKENPNDTINQLLQALYHGTTTIKGEAEKIFHGFLGMGYSTIFNKASNIALGTLTKNVLRDYCSKFGKGDILRDMGVEGGIGATVDEGVKIQVEYCTDIQDPNKVKITADYIYIMDYPFLDMMRIPCRACASTAIWGGGEVN